MEKATTILRGERGRVPKKQNLLTISPGTLIIERIHREER